MVRAAVWSIRALRLGSLQAPPSMLRSGASGLASAVPVVMWVLRAGDQVVVVDTGTRAANTNATRFHGVKLVRPDRETPVRALARLSLDPLNISVVVNTHLHWDHASNNHLFKKARVVVQSAELVAALAPPSGHEAAYESPSTGQSPSWARALSRLMLVTGDVDLLPGVRLVHLPGHTPGSQGVLVDTASGPVLIAGDLVPIASNVDLKPPALPGITSSESEARASLHRAISLSSRIVGSHDAGLFEHSLDSVVSIT